jgi:SAM-dependent methyltransferase
MLIPRPIRAIVKSIVDPRIIKMIRRSLVRTLPALNVYRALLSNKNGLEIGGPTHMFTDEGQLPIYSVVGSLNNCLFSSQCIWAGQVPVGAKFEFHPKSKSGELIISEASNLKCIGNSTYELILASHCLEHLANPLRALAEWKRVLSEDGLLLLILPHKERTFDWRRPTTSLAHMISDFERGIGEDDVTHLEEILQLHDLERDKAAGTPEQFRQRCLQNFENRAIHHHVFSTPTAVELIDLAGFKIMRVDNAKPYHIIILARSSLAKPDNTEFLSPNAEYRGRSPFPGDW